MTIPYTEDAQQVIYDAMFNAPPCRHWAMSIPCLGCLSEIAAAALSSANRLVPPGSETFEQWIITGDDDGDGWISYAQSREDALKYAKRYGGEVAVQKVVTFPPVPDTEEGS